MVGRAWLTSRRTARLGRSCRAPFDVVHGEIWGSWTPQSQTGLGLGPIFSQDPAGATGGVINANRTFRALVLSVSFGELIKVHP